MHVKSSIQVAFAKGFLWQCAEGLRGVQTPTGQRPHQPPLDTGVPAVSQRSLSSADLGALGGVPPRGAATAGGDSAPASLELAGRESLGGIARGHADPSAVMRALLAAQVGICSGVFTIKILKFR